MAQTYTINPDFTVDRDPAKASQRAAKTVSEIFPVFLWFVLSVSAILAVYWVISAHLDRKFLPITSASIFLSAAAIGGGSQH